MAKNHVISISPNCIVQNCKITLIYTNIMHTKYWSIPNEREFTALFVLCIFAKCLPLSCPTTKTHTHTHRKRLLYEPWSMLLRQIRRTYVNPNCTIQFLANKLLINKVKLQVLYAMRCEPTKTNYITYELDFECGTIVNKTIKLGIISQWNDMCCQNNKFAWL